MRLARRHLVGIATVSLVIVSGSAKATSYTFTELQPLDRSASAWMIATGLNNMGQVVGTTMNPSSQDLATTWIDGIPQALPMPQGGRNSYGRTINDSGKIVGTVQVVGPYAPAYASTWVGDTQTSFSPFGGDYPFSTGASINNSGQIAGWATYTGVGVHGALWNGSSKIELYTLGGGSSMAYASNEVGQAVGWAHTYANSARHAARWDSTDVTGWDIADLGTLGGQNSLAYDINNKGIAVGQADDAKGLEHAVMWTADGKIVELDPVGGPSPYSFSVAYAINQLGQIAGTTSRGATLWDNGNAVYLNDFFSPSLQSEGWVLGNARDINDKGQILVDAYNPNQVGQYLGFVMTPSVPEPSTYAMLFAGFAGLGYAARRNGRKPAH